MPRHCSLCRTRPSPCGEVRDTGLQAAVETKSYDPVYIQTIENELCDEGEQEG